MKLMLLLGMAVGLGAAASAVTTQAAPETREGYVMPEACKSREADGGPQAHTTRCALELECVVTGYGLWVDGQFFEFDDAGDQVALRYFRDTEKSDHHLVRVKGDFSGAEVHVETLEPVAP